MARPAQTKRDPTLEVLVATALEIEAAPWLRMLQAQRATTGSGFQLTEGTFGGRPLGVATLSATGTSRDAALDGLVAVHRPRWLVSAGFAVGIASQVRVGDVVAASEITDDGSDVIPTDYQGAPGTVGQSRLHVGRLVNVSRWPESIAAKRELGQRTGALAADRQSFALARFARDRGVQFAGLRIVADDASRDAPPGTRAVYHESASFRAGGVAGALFSGTAHITRLLKLRGEAKRHAERLAETLSQWLPRLA
jgi:adenosylhomocysteine nucleosidase